MLESTKPSKLCVTGFCEGNPPAIGGFPLQRTSNAESVSMTWRPYTLTYPCNEYSYPLGRLSKKPFICQCIREGRIAYLALINLLLFIKNACNSGKIRLTVETWYYYNQYLRPPALRIILLENGLFVSKNLSWIVTSVLISFVIVCFIYHILLSHEEYL